jgi:putative ABC transport system ATP-binding protein
METVVELTDLRYAWPGAAQPVLDVRSLRIARGERLFVRGPSGSGKSTLLGLLAGVLVPQSGDVRVLGRDLGRLSGPARDRFRADHVGFIFQMFNLIPYLSVVENVRLPCGFSPERLRKAAAGTGGVDGEARRLLAQLGLADEGLLRRPVTALSMGQQQRVAAARALIGAPEIVIADEPTSALDAALRADFLKLLFAECEQAGSTLVFVSHDASLEDAFDRTLSIGAVNRAAAGVAS